MLSHNNWEEQIKKYEPKKQRFTIKKLSVGVASVLLGVTFAAGTASADSTTANADSASGSDSAEQTDHNLTLNSTSTSTLKSATAASQNNSASAAVQNPAGDVKAQAANDYEAAVSAAVANASSDVASDAVQNSSASSVQSSSAADSSAQASAVKSTATQAFSVRSAAVNNFNYASVFASLAAMQQSNNDNAAAQADTNSNDEYSNYKTVTDWSGLQSAVSSGAEGVIVSGNITATNGLFNLAPHNDLNIYGNFTIIGADKNASINLNNNVIQNNGNLTLKDITVNGSILGNGTVNIQGTVTSNADASNSAIVDRSNAWLDNNLVSAIDRKVGLGVDTGRTSRVISGTPYFTYKNWYNSNIAASRVNVGQGAILNINRSVTGDGIDLGRTGAMNVGVNGALSINLKDAQNKNMTETATSMDNANAGIRALDNGTFTTGDSAKVTINAGHGRAIVFNEPFGGNSSVQAWIMPTWENGRTGDHSSQAAGHTNTVALGDSTQMSISGRGGLVLGYNATFTTGDHSVVTMDNYGNGEGLLLDANGKVIVSPHSQLLMHSNGKDTGSYDGGNYIGLGQNGQFRVEHDATFRYQLVNAGQGINGGKKNYSDNFNIISQVNGAHPLVYVGNNATFDGQSDYAQGNGEIIAFSLDNNVGNQDAFIIDGAKYVNWERNSVSTGFVGGTSPQGNLYYSMAPSIIDASKQKYYIFKWFNGNLNDNNFTYNSDQVKQSIDNFKNSSDEYWQGIEHLATSYSKNANLAEAPGHNVTASDITGESTVGQKKGIPVNNFSDSTSNNTGFDPKNSQRLVLVASSIPTQEDVTTQQDTDATVILKYNENLPAGTVKVTQKGVAGLSRKTTTTYYDMDPATGNKTIDTTKGGWDIIKDGQGNVINKVKNNTPGVDNVITTITMVPEIIEVGPQEITLKYVNKTTGTTLKTTTVNGNPLKTNSDNTVVFNEDGTVVANSITEKDFVDGGQTVQQIIKGYTDQKLNVVDNTLASAIKDGTAKFNVSGVTRTTLSNSEQIPAQGPAYEIDFEEEAKDVQGSVTYIDDTTGKTLATDNFNGKVGENITYKTADKVTNYEKQGYVLVSNGFKDGKETFKENGNDFTVHLKHGYTTIDKNNPNGHTVTASVNRTVNYTVDGKADSTLPGHTETVNFSATGYEDTVTHQLVDVVNGEIVTENNTIKPGSLTWTVDGGNTDSATMNGYDAPTKDHYHVDANGITVTPADQKTANVDDKGKVNTITVNHESQNITVTIPLVANGTKLVDQGKTKNTSATVRYIVDGNDTNKPQAPADNVQDGFEFTYSGDTYDAYTNELISKGTWSPNSHAYNEVASPTVAGYTPDKATVTSAELTVTQDKPEVKVIVHYTKNAEEKATLKIWDDTTNTQIGATMNAQGDENTPISFAGGKAAVQGYLDNGYKFVSVVSDANGNTLSTTNYDAANFGNYDTDSNSDQSFTVHLVHGTKPVNPENPTDKYTKNDLQKTSTRTVNYVDAQGNKLADSVTSTVVFSGSGYVDTVTGNLVNLNNDGSIKDQNGKLTWTYSVDGGKAQSGENYIFAETAAKPTIQHDGVNYRFNNVNPGNYNAGNGAVSSYQVDNSKDNNLNVNVVYNKITYTTKRVNERTVNRTINYLDGKTGEKIPANLIAGNPVNQSATLYQTQIVDDQGNEMGNGTVSEDGTSYTNDNTWHVDGSFDAVTSPDLTKSGYKAPRFENGKSAATVSAETVNENTPKQDTVNVYYDHNEVPVTPDNPHGVDPKQLTKDVNETVHYIVEDGKVKAPDDSVQTSKWTRTLTLDEVTKELVPNGQYDTEWAIAKGAKTNYDQVNTPVVKGYYANKANVPATAVTQSNIYTEVTYKPLGHIIPVDPTTGNPIPNAPQPQFPNDPNDPTKGNPGEKPTVPGYHPQDGKPGEPVSPVPGNPGEDVKVPYVKDQGTVSVIFHDDTTNTTIPNVGFNSGDAAADTPVTYNPETNISDLEKQGYVYVRTEGTLPDKVEANKNITVTVHMKHGVQPVTPTTPPTDVPKNTPKEAQPDQLTKKVNLTVNYVNADGTDFTGNVPANAKQTATFTGTAYVDKITGQLVNAKQEDGKWVINTDDTATPEITWTSDKNSFEGVTSPAEKGYHVSNVSSHADGDNVAAITGLTKDSQDITVTVTYAKNGTKVVGERTVKASMTVHYTGAGDLTPKDNVQSGVNFHYTGDVHDAETDELVSEGHWEVNGVAGDSYQFNEVDSPVVSGYTAETKVVPGFKATPDKPTFETTVNYTKNGTDVQNKQHVPASQTVQYVDDQGNTLRPDKSQNFEFNYSGDTVDKVTGETIEQGIWNETSHNFAAADVPVIKGYVAVSGYTNNNGKYTAGGFTATNTGSKEDNNKVFTVVYKKVGKIVPQLPDGKPVPNVPNVPYTNDPTNPTAVTPDEPTPKDPTGTYTPEVPSVTPTNPTKDTPVVYHANEASLKVEYIDQDDNNAVLHTDSVDGKLGEKLTYTTADEIKSLEGQGYVLVNDGFTGKAGADFTKENNGKTYQVILKHGVQPVTPTTPPTDVPKNTPKEAQPDQLTKKVNLTVNYVNADGTAFTGNVPANAKQTATFTGTAYVDKITGKLVNAKQEDGKWVINTDDTATPEITWTSDKTSFEGVTSPAENGYHVSNVSSHADGDNVAAITGLTKDSQNITVTVTYAKNGTTVINGKKVTPTQTVKFVDGEGNELKPSIKETGADFVYSGDTLDEVTGQITKTGSWDSTSHIFGTQDVPVIDGYVAVSGYTNQNGKFVAGGLTATLDDPNVVATVVYQKVGNIVPQLPDGTPVPNPDKPGENVPNKPYTNDPSNPTDVNPKEPVPNIPGYRPEVPTVTPEVPTKDTPVVYNQIQKADLTIVDQDNGNKQIVVSGVTTKFATDGINGEAITFAGNEAAVKALENMGYVYVDSDFTSGTKFDGDGATDQHFTITMKHGTQPVNPSTPGKPGEPINPNDPEGPKYPQGSDQVTKNVTRTIQYVDENGNKVSDSVEQPVNFTAEGVLDKVTGQWVTPLTWSGSQTVNGVKSPVVEGYHLVSVDRDGEGNNVKGVTLTHENDSYTVTVKYAKNGKIIPVDPTGKPIPNVPTPQYPTDPTDPSKVTPNEPVPSIPGLTPEVPTVTPTDPGKNTPVKYSQTVNATVTYIDDVTGESLKTDSLSGLEGVKSDYSTKSSIDGYEAQGYKVVSDNFPKGGYTFSVEGTHDFTVHLTHTTSPVNPDHPGAGYSATDLKKTVTRTINYLDGQGNVVAQQVAQSFDFIANGTVDNVTHKLVTVVDGKITGAGELTWNAANHDFDAVESPAVKGMHVTNVTPADQREGNNVAKTTVNAQSGNIIVNVYYASNGTHQDGAKNLLSTQTVTFVDEAGNVLHVPSTLDFTFVRTPDVTDPEGNVTEGTWTTGTSHTYKTVNVPVIPGYVTDRTVAGGMTATIDNLDVADKVVYKKVGKIIPVDPTGKPIPGAPTPDYPNDPQNPTKVTPDEPVPSVPGYTPDVPTVTPGVPTVDTPVTYRQNVQVTVTYIDDVTNTVLDSDSLNGLDGKKSDYSTAGKIANYESHGYALVSDDFPKDGYTFSVEGTHNFTVHLTHTTSPVNPDHPGAGYNKTDLQKDVTRTIYFVNTQDGKQVAEPVNQTVSFTANGTVDNVTGKLVTVADGKITGPGELTWTPAQDVKGVQSPAVNGMHVTFVTRDADGTNVKGVSLTHDDSSYDVYVNYAPNGTTNEHGQNIPASQTIKFVDENGNTLRENNVQTSEFVRTPDVVDAFTGKTITEGSWKETSHKFGVIDVPVIEGYVATVKTAGGLTATTDNPNVVTEVVYKKVGKIIPVDPTGKPIPNVPTPEYPNDPTDPTKVTPNEPVPTIPGYTPETPTVTPEVPTKDTPVKYTPVDNTQNAQVRYIDLTNNEEIANSGNLSGQPGDKINYSTADTIKSLTDKGYVLVNDGFPADAAFDNDKGHDQVFTVTFRHGTQPVNPNEPGKPGQPINPNDPEGPKYPQGSDQVTKNVTRTVQYVDENGNKISDPVEQTVNFTAEGVLDKVTGQWVTPLTWSGSQSVAGVKTPVVEGYHVVNVDRDGDGVNVKGVTLTHENDNYTVTVQYAKNGKIVPVDPTGKPIPNVPTPQYPTDPENPAKVTPDEPVPSIPGFVPEVPTVTPTDPGKDTPVHYTPVVNDQNAVVNYVDQDNNNAQIATSGNLTGKPGSLIDYSTAATIKQLEDQGYVLVSNGFPAGAVFDNDDNTTQTYTVVLKHGTTTFKPDKPGTPGEPINPNYPEGPKVTNEDVDYSKDVKFTVHYVGAGSNNPADNVQNAQWTRAITVDNVTGKIISSTEWVSNKDSYSNVATPVVEGYHADRAQVDGHKVTMEDQEATVTYVPNGKIVPVDPTGKPIPNVPTPQYPTDPTDPTKVTPDEPVPTIPNYTPEVPTVTPTDPGVDTPVKYTPNTVNPKPAVDQIAVVNYVDQDNNNAQIATSGNLTGKAGSVINYSTADEIKQLEAHGYVLVTDGFPAGATFDDNADQNQVFTVVLKHGHAPVGPKNPEEPGTPVNPGYPEGPKWPAKDNYSKDYTSTVHFVDNNGNKMRDDNVQTSTWTRTLIIDKVTGQILNPNENWTSDKASYNEVKVPVINGYVADKANVPAKEAVQQNIEDTVTYTKVGNIVPVDPSGNRIPNVPVVPYTNDPTDPTKVVPNEPVPSVPGMTPNVTTVTPDHPTVDTPVVYTTPTPVTPQTPVTPEPETPAEPARPAETPAQPAAPEAPAAPKAATPAKATPAAKQEAKKLPQTGNENSSSAAALGLAALGLTGLLAAGKKRRKED